MQPLDKASERKIMAAIEKTATYVNEGASPNEAIVKAAARTACRPATCG